MAEPHGQLISAKYCLGRGAETEAHLNAALCLSPRDVFAHRWLGMVGLGNLQLVTI
jgi:hypothetical protein